MSVKNIAVISFGDYDFDGRLRALIDNFSQLGNVYCFTRGTANINIESVNYSGGYLKFIYLCVRYIKKIKRKFKLDAIILDNRKATIPGLILKQIMPAVTYVQDCRELYLLNETHSLIGKLGCIFERKMSKKAHIVICANEERAERMVNEYGLSIQPLVYENLRQLKYSSEKARLDAEKKLSKYIHDGEIRVVSSSGCSIARTNDVLVDNFDKIKAKCRLFLVGDSTAKDIKAMKQLISEKGLKNVEILGRLNQAELKYLIEKSHIGIVNYHQNDTNNRLCASGKLFEFIYEGIPVVATSNPPLKRICEKWCIGRIDDKFYNGINSIISNYMYYKQRIEEFVGHCTIADNDNQFIKQIREKLEWE
ncbi:MAG: glycosyltransferase family 4 protein [Lachnospiraceae bacterium]|nr:glycosyltransferase [uncultured Acetatifactor sp.]MCI8800042.1 glycosyltransferase family 4 protein [Lachnospiraceae bacterium]